MTRAKKASSGRLVLVATPIGNLGDLSPRGVEALASADVLACEDTRRTRKLLSHAGVAAPRLVAVHDHTEAAFVRQLLAFLDRGETVVFVTDAGMPGISDPGERLVAAASAAGHAVDVVPGPSAAITALVVSGLPTGRFCFEGFLPRRGAARTDRLDALRAERRTTVIYEAPHRVAATIVDLRDALGPLRRVALCRELTKVFEEVWRGTLAGAVEHVAAAEPRGEYVIVVDGAPPPAEASAADVEAALRAALARGSSKRDAVSAVAHDLRVSKRRVYDAATGL